MTAITFTGGDGGGRGGNGGVVGGGDGGGGDGGGDGGGGDGGGYGHAVKSLLQGVPYVLKRMQIVLITPLWSSFLTHAALDEAATPR